MSTIPAGVGTGAGSAATAPATAEVAADPDDLARFVDQGRRHTHALDVIAARIAERRRLVVADLGSGVPADRVTPAFRDLIESVAETTALAASVGEALMIRSVVGFGPILRQAVLDGRVPPPDDRLRQRLLAALEAGQGPEEAGIDRAYFPRAYLRHRRLSERIAEAEAGRERADGHTWAWWDSDTAALATFDDELTRLRDRRDRLVDGAIDDDGTMGRFAAAALVAATTGGADWEGRFYGTAFVEHHRSRISDGGLFGFGRGELESPGGFGPELAHLARRVAADSDVAVAFYNKLGVGATADLASFVAGADAERATLEQLGRGLARASRAITPRGRPALAFGGAALIEHPRRSGQRGVVGYGPALLFLDGSFDDRFLTDATVAALRLAHDGDPRGFESHWGVDVVGTVPEVGITFDGGEDPRNILLGRVSEDPAAVRAVVDGLAADSFDALLRPAVPFGPTIGSDPDIHWLDRMFDAGNVTGPDHGDLSPLAYPDLADPYPITGFLGSVAADDELSRLILGAVASMAEAGPVLQDPGTAAGIDLVLAAHATLIFDRADLAAVGIEPTGLNDGPGPVVGPEQWRAVHEETLGQGRGQALAARAHDLLNEAIAGAADPDGRFQADLTRPFAHVAARTGAEASEALVAYAAELDDGARGRNRTANRSAALATTALGFVPVIGVAAAPIGIGWTWFFDGYPVDAELETLRNLRAEQRHTDRVGDWGQWAVRATLEAQLSAGQDGQATIELNVAGRGVERVAISRIDDGAGGSIRWLDPRSGRWSELPTSDVGAFEELVRAPGGEPTALWLAFSDGAAINEDYRDGLIASDRDREAMLAALVERHGGSIEHGRRSLDDAIGDTAWTEPWIGGSAAAG